MVIRDRRSRSRMSIPGLARIQEDDEIEVQVKQQCKPTPKCEGRATRRSTRRLTSVSTDHFEIQRARWEEQIERNLSQLVENLETLQALISDTGSSKPHLIGTYKAWETYVRSMEHMLNRYVSKK